MRSQKLESVRNLSLENENVWTRTHGRCGDRNR
jgi:hypothetical protein